MSEDMTTEFGQLHIRRTGKWTDVVFDLIDHPGTEAQTDVARQVAAAMADRCVFSGRREATVGGQDPKCWTVTVPSHHRQRTADVLLALRRDDHGPAAELLRSCEPFVVEMRTRRATAPDGMVSG
jgi:hypothetical protein